MWDWIVNILFELLKLIQTFAVDWGLSIIILWWSSSVCC